MSSRDEHPWEVTAWLQIKHQAFLSFLWIVWTSNLWISVCRQVLGIVFLFKAIICSVTNDLEPHKDQMWDETSINQDLHLLKQGPVMTTVFKGL